MPYPLKSSGPTIPAARIKNGTGIFSKLSSPKVVRAIETVCRSINEALRGIRSARDIVCQSSEELDELTLPVPKCFRIGE